MSRTRTLVAGAAGLALLLAPLATSSARAAGPSATAGSSSSASTEIVQHKWSKAVKPSARESGTRIGPQADEPNPTVTTANVDAGQTVSFKASGCDDVAGAAKTLVGIWVPGQGADAAPKAEVELAPEGGSATYRTTEPGFYSAVALCVDNGGATVAASDQADAFAYPTEIGFDPTTWTEGDAITLSTFGFREDEQVAVTMTHDKTGKSYWNTTLTASVSIDSDAKGMLANEFKNVVLPNNGPEGDYTLVLKGADGLVRTGRFYWGSPDNDKPKPAPTPSTSRPGTPEHPGLPSTGV